MPAADRIQGNQDSQSLTETERTLVISERLRVKAAELMDLIDETLPVLRDQITAAREIRERGGHVD